MVFQGVFYYVMSGLWKHQSYGEYGILPGLWDKKSGIQGAAAACAAAVSTAAADESAVRRTASVQSGSSTTIPATTK